jgi:hypothetical protein
LAAWHPPAGDPSAGVFGERTLVVEDASPDSCFALVCLLARWSGVAVDAIPHDWVEHIGRWELGDVITTGEPHSSFGALHNALVHSFLYDACPAWGQAWVAGLRFLLSALQSGDPPDHLGHEHPWPELEQARAFLDFEYQTYLDGLDFATRVQLRIPMTPVGAAVNGDGDAGGDRHADAGEARTQTRTRTRDRIGDRAGTPAQRTDADAGAPADAGAAGRRWRLVDAYLAREALPQGSLKSFLRTDREHTWFKNGFTLMALYKPADIGTGNDLSVSVTPGRGIDLRDLWRRLEELEYQAWGGWEQRPR